MYFQDRLLSKLDKKRIDSILWQFGFGPSFSFHPISGLDTLGMVADTKKEEALLRFFRPEKGKDDIIFVIELLLYLEKKGLPVGKIHQAKNGEYLIYKKIGKMKVPIMAREFLAGEQKNELSKDELYLAGEVLAKLHEGFLRFPNKKRKKIDILKSTRVLYKSLVKKLKREKDRQFKILWLSFYPEFLKELGKNREVFESTGLIHGDFHQANILFENGRVSGIFDFDQVSLGPKIADLARFAVNYTIIAQESGGGAPLVSAVLTNLLSGYESRGKLDKKEKEMLPDLTTLFFFEKANWALAHKKEFGDYADQLFIWCKEAIVEA